MKKILFLDRDGTIIKEPQDMQVDAISKLRFLPECIYYLRKIVEETNYHLVMVTNQDGLGTPVFKEEDFWQAHNLMMQVLADEGINFIGVHIDKSFAAENLSTRKPNTGMLLDYFSEEFDLKNSIVIGDRYTDIQLAKNLGAKGILIGRSIDTTDDDKLNIQALSDVLIGKTETWKDIYDLLSKPDRKAKISRNTSETKIEISINLDGKGESDINTGIAFFDHMLTQIAKHGEIDLLIKVEGDLHIDEHHTIEDTALALGEAFLNALGDKKGIERYAFVLPMDDCLAQVALDFGGRPWIVWEVDFIREKIGEMPTEMFFHFFKSFSDTSKCNLNISATGQNEHHKIESIFKAFAKCIKQAKTRSSNTIPSTKGVI